ncbi:uncharacterized protein [Hemitrygon akajei]|uniref:uncharacterized protein n=1 Tax=Hemitrygon akajei TaxID=2704970 RepID=UPI003BF98AEB
MLSIHTQSTQSFIIIGNRNGCLLQYICDNNHPFSGNSKKLTSSRQGLLQRQSEEAAFHVTTELRASCRQYTLLQLSIDGGGIGWLWKGYQSLHWLVSSFLSVDGAALIQASGGLALGSQRKSATGTTLPAWLTSPGPVLLWKHARSNKYSPLVERVHLLHANPQYAYVVLPDGREDTVSVRNLAPAGAADHDPEHSTMNHLKLNHWIDGSVRIKVGYQPLEPLLSFSNSWLLCTIAPFIAFAIYSLRRVTSEN